MKKIIDPLGIFGEIKDHINAIYPNTLVIAFGSRVRGKSFTGKWDFDVIALEEKTTLDIHKLNHSLTLHFRGKKDENGNPIKVDCFKRKEPFSKKELKKAGIDGCLL